MESTSNEEDKGKHPTKASASAMRKNAVDNPPKKQSWKRAAESETEAARSTGPEPQPEAAQVTEEAEIGDDIAREPEEEKSRGRVIVLVAVFRLGGRLGWILTKGCLSFLASRQTLQF
jgi:hypothetical protein